MPRYAKSSGHTNPRIWGRDGCRIDSKHNLKIAKSRFLAMVSTFSVYLSLSLIGLRIKPKKIAVDPILWLDSFL